MKIFSLNDIYNLKSLHFIKFNENFLNMLRIKVKEVYIFMHLKSKIREFTNKSNTVLRIFRSVCIFVNLEHFEGLMAGRLPSVVGMRLLCGSNLFPSNFFSLKHFYKQFKLFGHF